LLARLLLFFTIFPLIELSLLILLGQKTSVMTTVGFVLITGLIGAVMLRWQGLQAWRKVQQDMQNGVMPTDSLVDGLLIVIASLLLISPGVITDLVGITLLIPWFRRAYRWLAIWYFTEKFAGRFTQRGTPTDPPGENRRTEVIDSHFVENQPPSEDR
jgi:UPF0716 protein FxsA